MGEAGSGVVCLVGRMLVFKKLSGSWKCHLSQQQRQTAAGLEEINNTWLLI